VPSEPTLDPDIGPYILLFAAGFGIGVLGHIFGSKTLIATGIAVIYCSIVFIPLYVYLQQ
jgi:hypothetical protein